MQTPEEILKHYGVDPNSLTKGETYEINREISKDFIIEKLAYQNQLLLDEVNRLNGVVEKVLTEVESFHTLYDKCKNIRNIVKL